MGMLELRKWYGDCVSDSGETVVRHWAMLSWGPFRIPYAALVRCAPDGTTTERIAWRRGPEPSFDGRALTWCRDRTGAAATWSSAAPQATVTLIDTPGCTIEWTVHAPACETEMSFHGNDTVRGLGYAEFLRISLSDRYLPFEHVRWGRFTAPGASLAWIDWRGAHPGSWALLDGVPVDGVSITDGHVALDARDVRMVLLDRTSIRRGRLQSGALKGIPVAGRWFLRRFGSALETRWRSRATLSTAGALHTGWAIHEHVHLPRR